MLLGILVFILYINKNEAHSKSFKNEFHLSEDTHLSTEELDKIRKFLKSFETGTNWKYLNGSLAAKEHIVSCHSYRNCQECINNKWSLCGWCHDTGCTENPEKLCPFAQSRPTTNSSEGVNICPYIKHDGPILITSGIKIDIKLKIYVPDPVIYDKEIICQIKFKDRLTHLKGYLIDDIILCYPVKLHATHYTGIEIGSLILIWGGSNPFSNDIPVTLYKCESLANECETCRLIPPEYDCGWCDETQSCVVNEKCSNNIMRWTLSRQNCEAADKKMYFV